jgi:RHS repeat-associated protein
MNEALGVKGWRVILVACALLWGSVDAFALCCATPELTPKNRCTPVFGTGVSRARYYSPGTGRFWTMDTYAGNNEDPRNLHKYLYGADNPVNKTDPSGNDYGDFSIRLSSIGSSLATSFAAIGSPVTSKTGLGAFLPIKVVGDADIDGQLNWVYNKIEKWAKLHGPIPDEPHKLWYSMMRTTTVDTIYKGEKESHYLYQYNGTKHPRLKNRTFINSDINYIGFGEGCCARGWNVFRMEAGISWHLYFDYAHLHPSDNTFAAAEEGWYWAVPKFSPNPRRH